MRWTEDDLKMVTERIKNAGNKNRAAVQTADMEPHTGNESLAENEVKRPDSPCHIHIHSKRHKCADPDGISAKYAIDGLIHAGILTDDNVELVKEVTYSQEKISRKENEETIITIAWAENTPNSPVVTKKPGKRTKTKEKLEWA